MMSSKCLAKYVSKSLALPLVAFLCLPGLVSAHADYASLANGFRLRVDRQETKGSKMKLYITGGGYVEVEASEIRSYEIEEKTPQSAPAAGPHDVMETVSMHGMDPMLLKSVIAEESNFNPKA